METRSAGAFVLRAQRVKAVSRRKVVCKSPIHQNPYCVVVILVSAREVEGYREREAKRRNGKKNRKEEKNKKKKEKRR